MLEFAPGRAGGGGALQLAFDVVQVRGSWSVVRVVSVDVYWQVVNPRGVFVWDRDAKCVSFSS
eukprot:2890750-Pyramimonas_sp.AAC.1